MKYAVSFISSHTLAKVLHQFSNLGLDNLRKKKSVEKRHAVADVSTGILLSRFFPEREIVSKFKSHSIVEFLSSIRISGDFSIFFLYLDLKDRKSIPSL